MIIAQNKEFKLLSKTHMAYDKALLNVEVYGPPSMHDEPGSPYGVSLESCPLLLLHGNGGSLQEFKKQIEYFAPHRTVIAIDSRGQGESTGASLNLSYELMADDVIEIINRLGVPELHFVGFSDGAIISILIAKNYPLRVKSLTAIGANINPEGLSQDARRQMEEELKAIRLGKVKKVPLEYDHESPQELLELMVNEPQIAPKELIKISAPTQLITGEFDLITPEHTELILRAIPQCSHHCIVGADHFLLESHADELNKLIETHITGHERRLAAVLPSISPDLEVRKLSFDDKDDLYALFTELIDSLDQGLNYAGWKKGVYPTLDHADKGLAEDNIYGCFTKEDGRLVGCMRLCFDMEEHFNTCGWELLPQEEVLMLRTVISSPSYRGSGVGKSMVAFAIDFARKHKKCRAIRFNTSGQNVPANYIYTRMGFKRYYSILQPYRGLDISDWTNPYEMLID